MLARFRRSALGALSLALLVASPAAALDVKTVKAQLTTVSGVGDVTHTLQPGSTWPELALGSGDSLRIQLTVSESGSPVVPAYAAVQFVDADGRDSEYAVGVKATGKASFVLNTDKLPNSLRAAASPLKATLLLSSPGSKPVSWALGSVTLPAAPADVTPTRRRHDLPPRAGEPAFAPQPEITHTFRVEEKTVAFPKAAAGVAALVLPWGVLFSLIGKISSSLQFVTPPTMMYALFVCLVGLEALILRYWAGWRLYELLGPFIGLAVVTAYVGTVGLRAARVERLKAGGKP